MISSGGLLEDSLLLLVLLLLLLSMEISACIANLHVLVSKS